MSSLSVQESEQLRTQLQEAVIKCSERCLYQSAKWAAELLSSLPIPTHDNVPSPASDRTLDDSHMFESSSRNTHIFSSHNTDPVEAQLEAQELSRYLLAKSYFDCREYDRCAAVFVPNHVPTATPSSLASPAAKLQTPTAKKGKGRLSTPGSGPDHAAKVPPIRNRLPRLSQKALFLSLYARLMAGEKRKDEDSEMILGPADGGTTVNKEMVGISRDLEGWFGEHTGADQTITGGQGWLEYLYGVILAKGKNNDEARKWLIRSVWAYPFHWGAWQELSGILGSVEALTNVQPLLPPHIMTFIFHLYSSQELYQATDVVHQQLTELQRVFPESPFLQTQRALLLYHSKDFDEAETIFSQLLHADPHRIDALDYYSNILYVMNLRPKLAFLAQLATATDKFRPETCCVVGNYYSLKSEHEKAVMYFRRALTLDRSFLSAWTLMGHEYVEMKNTHAAIESYRRAVDVNRKDYRAWYGLGQTYEVLEMHFYALFYYQRAASLHAYDPKMWQAVGSSFARMDRCEEAIKAFKRALAVGGAYDGGGSSSFGSGSDPSRGSTVLDPEMLFQIALMYERLNDFNECASYMELVLAQEHPVSATTSTDAPDEPSSQDTAHSQDAHPDGVKGVGVTLTTSKARMWLARFAFTRGDLERALGLATELCQDGVEVEEARALVGDCRGRLEGRGKGES
ncbi:MAG: Anaphase-promoting complex subunit 23 [Caeruleum heppii]|nr:MAG: Anaphase-promoting complex subunit 23 [Caeruleum heppii]